MTEKDKSEGKTQSTSLGLFNKPSLSTNCDKDQASDVSPSSTQTIRNESSSSSNLLSSNTQLPSSSRAYVSTNPVADEDKSSTVRFKRIVPSSIDKEIGQRPENVRRFFDIPCGDEPIISVMNFKDLNLDRTFSTDTSLMAPQRVGYFSCHINSDGKTQSYRPDKSSLRYLCYEAKENIHIDLLEGFNPDVTWSRVPPGEMHILRWLSENEYDCYNKNNSNDDTRDNIDFICYTQILRSIMSSPFNFIDDWTGIAIKVRGSIILDEMDKRKFKAFVDEQTLHEMAGSYAGYKFKEKVTRMNDGCHVPTYLDGYRDPFYIVCKTKLNSHTILYCTRADCAENEHQLDKDINEMKFVQIKTRQKYYREQSRDFFWKRRAISWWIESKLGNIDQIICGDKNNNFFITRVININVDSLPREENLWSPRTCVSFLDQVLSYIKSMVTDELTPYRFYYIPGRAIVCQKINEPVENYLPSWFINNEQPDDD